MSRELRLWLRFMLLVDAVGAVVLLLVPLAWLARLPVDVLPLPEQPLAVRLFGLYAAALAACWWRAPESRDALALGNWIRLAGTFAFVLAAAEDWFGWMPREEASFDVFGIAKVEISPPPHEPVWPPLLQSVGLCEAIVLGVTIFLQRRAGRA